ncbi:MAG: hypothetical protein V4603_12890 [Pseudomonadota bacterium]
MAERPLLRVLYVLAAVLYPVLIYFGLQTVNPRWLILIVVLVAMRYLIGTQFSPLIRVVWGICLATLVAVTMITGSATALLVYPVLVNAMMLVLFFSSWLKPPTVIEMFARRREPELPVAAIIYTRKLTLVWCGFFVINGGISLATLALSREWWLLYNGLISYVLIGALLLGEMLIRKRMLARTVSAT